MHDETSRQLHNPPRSQALLFCILQHSFVHSVSPKQLAGANNSSIAAAVDWWQLRRQTSHLTTVMW